MESIYKEYIYEDYIKNSLITGHFINGHKELKRVLLRYDLAKIMSPKTVDILIDKEVKTKKFYVYLQEYFSNEDIYQLIADYGFFS